MPDEGMLGDARSPPLDVAFLALPNDLAPAFAAAAPPSMLVLDLSSDHRFDDTWTYGLVERRGAREALARARRIAVPGCYATAMQLALMPLVAARALAPASTVSAFGVSGYSGAGTSKSDKSDPRVLADNLISYSLAHHIHEREVTRHCATQVRFTPTVASFFRGIHMVTHAQLVDDAAAANAAALYTDFYADEPLVDVVVGAEPPRVRDNVGWVGGRVGGFVNGGHDGRLVVVSTIDNLLKGAASQAIQCMNVASGLEERLGLE